MRLFETAVLETERLILRPFREQDAEEMFVAWANDPEVARYVVWAPHGDVSVTRRLLASWTALTPEDRHAEWCLELKQTGKPVGSIAAMSTSRDPEALELGWCLRRSLWGRGLMPEAADAVIRYLRTAAEPTAIYAQHLAVNERSGRVMQKLGMRVWGDSVKDMKELGPQRVVIYQWKEGGNQ